MAIEPEEISSFGGGFALKSREEGNADFLEPASQSLLLAAPQGLTHAQEDGAAIGDQDGIEDEDGVRAVRLRFGMLDDLGAGGAQQPCQGIVLAPGRLQIRPRRVMPARRIGVAEGRVRPADKDPPQRRDHALAAVAGGHARRNPNSSKISRATLRSTQCLPSASTPKIRAISPTPPAAPSTSPAPIIGTT
jgi:hypothetical protein